MACEGDRHEHMRVLPGWQRLRCTGAGAADFSQSENAINASWRAPHSDIFQRFVPARFKPNGDLLTDFLGVRYPVSTYCSRKYMIQPVAHAIRTRQCDVWKLLAASNASRRPSSVQTAWPVVSEEYLEYVDVLSAVDEYVRTSARRRPFAFVELGSGYGHWALAASAALRQRLPELTTAQEAYILVDMVPSLESTVTELARLNGIRPSAVRFHAGLVVSDDHADDDAPSHAPGERSTADEPRGLTSGLGPKQRAALERDSASWASNWQGDGSAWKSSGQGEAAVRREPSGAAPLREVLTLDELLSMTRGTPECIDMVDIDIQGGEYPLSPPGQSGGAFSQYGQGGLFSSDRTARTLTRRARLVHIGLHGTRTQDEQLISALRTHGWELRWYFPQVRGRATHRQTVHTRALLAPTSPSLVPHFCCNEAHNKSSSRLTTAQLPFRSLPRAGALLARASLRPARGRPSPDAGQHALGSGADERRDPIDAQPALASTVPMNADDAKKATG